MRVRSKRILVIEDDECIREMLRIALEFEGFEVAAAADGREGLEVLAATPRPGLILLDLMMPVMNGWEFCQELRALPALADIPVVILSAFVEKGASIEAHAVIKKPFSLDTLVDTVNGIVEDASPGVG